MSAAGPSFNAVYQGRAAATLAFRVIDRPVKINQDSETAVNHKLTGQIKFDSVDFFYPTRPEAKVLRNFSCTFEVGKTTAIVGPSGSGKSTTI